MVEKCTINLDFWYWFVRELLPRMFAVVPNSGIHYSRKFESFGLDSNALGSLVLEIMDSRK